MVNTTGLVVARHNAGDDTWSTWQQAADAPPRGLLKSEHTVLVAAGTRLAGRSVSDRYIRGTTLDALDLRTGQWSQIGERETRSPAPARAVQASDGSLWLSDTHGVRRFDLPALYVRSSNDPLVDHAHIFLTQTTGGRVCLCSGRQRVAYYAAKLADRFDQV